MNSKLREKRYRDSLRRLKKEQAFFEKSPLYISLIALMIGLYVYFFK